MELNRVVRKKDRMPLLKKLNTVLAMVSRKEEITVQWKFYCHLRKPAQGMLREE